MNTREPLAGIWRGETVEDASALLAGLSEKLSQDLALKLDITALLDAADALSMRLREPDGEELEKGLGRPLVERGLPQSDVRQTLQVVAEVLSRKNLQAKLRHELGSSRPQDIRRRDYRNDVFESWAPLGVLVHVAAGNAPSVAPLSVVEGLLAGNINILKISSRDSTFAIALLAALVDASRDRCLAPFVYAFRFSSRRSDLMEMLLKQADGVAAWGGEAAIAGIEKMVRPGTRVVKWGHKLSFSYITPVMSTEESVLDAVATDMCRIEQQACSSPQCVFLDTDSREELVAFAERLAARVPSISREFGIPEPSMAESAEITTVTQMVELDSCLDQGKAIEAEDSSWRLLVDYDPALRPSPLFRTLWVKPLPRERIVEMLRPMRSYLQTAAVACTSDEMHDLSRRLVAAGVTRVVEPGSCLGSYPGEPHDGVYALPQYSRRVGIQAAGRLDGVVDFRDLEPNDPPPFQPGTGIMDKQAFLDHEVAPGASELFFRSGGTSGTPKMSTYTYHDYHAQMRAAADGLYAAGMDPNTDLCMNLFFTGHLYGGFLSFHTILETLEVPYLPMGMVEDTGEVADAIIQHGVNTLAGMPSELVRIFQEQEEKLREYRGVRKIFYTGEPISPAQMDWFRDVFGVERIKSAVYGSNDAGAIGYTVATYPTPVQVLLSSVHAMEIVKMDSDQPVDAGEVGRILLSPRYREGQDIARYEIGDLGRWVDEPVPTGRTGPFFELCGRYGDIFKCGGPFLNYREFVRVMSEAGYGGRVQLVVGHDGPRELLTLRMEPWDGMDDDAIRQRLCDEYDVFDFLLNRIDNADFRIQRVSPDGMDVIASSGKLRTIVDRRAKA